MKRRIASLFMAIAMLLSMCISAVADDEERLIKEVGEEEPIGAERFTDIDRSYWAYTEVDGVVRAGLFNGTTRTRYEPYRNMTRAAFVLVLSRLEGLDLENQPVDSMRFSDVKTTSRFAAAINWAVENNIVTGYSDGTFRPDRSINRQQIAALVYRWIINRYLPDHPDQEVKLADNPVPQFSDYSDVSTTSDFREALNYCRLHGLINGYSNGTFRPYTRINRGQMAAILYRIILVIYDSNPQPYKVIVDPISQVNGSTDWSATRNGQAVNKADIEPGDTITILKEPADRYVVSNVRVLDAQGKKVSFVKTRTTFILPAAERLPVTIYVTYSRQSTGGGGGGGSAVSPGAVQSELRLTVVSNGGSGLASLIAGDTADLQILNLPAGQTKKTDKNATANTTVTIMATPDSDSRVGNVTVNNGSVQWEQKSANLFTFVMPASNATVVVEFVSNSDTEKGSNLKLSVRDNDDGATGTATLLAPGGILSDVAVGQTKPFEHKVQEERTVTVLTTPGDGCKVASVEAKEDATGVSLTVNNPASNRYTFVMPAVDATVTVKFETEAIPVTKYTLTLEGTENGTAALAVNGASVSSPVELEGGETITVTTSPAAGYVVDTVTYKAQGVTTDATVVETDKTYTFTMPQADTTVNVEFVVNSDTLFDIFTEFDPVGGTVSLEKYDTASNDWTAAETGHDVSALNDQYRVVINLADGYEIEEFTITNDKTGKTYNIFSSSTPNSTGTGNDFAFDPDAKPAVYPFTVAGDFGNDLTIKVTFGKFVYNLKLEGILPESTKPAVDTTLQATGLNASDDLMQAVRELVDDRTNGVDMNRDSLRETINSVVDPLVAQGTVPLKVGASEMNMVRTAARSEIDKYNIAGITNSLAGMDVSGFIKSYIETDMKADIENEIINTAFPGGVPAGTTVVPNVAITAGTIVVPPLVTIDPDALKTNLTNLVIGKLDEDSLSVNLVIQEGTLSADGTTFSPSVGGTHLSIGSRVEATWDLTGESLPIPYTTNLTDLTTTCTVIGTLNVTVNGVPNNQDIIQRKNITVTKADIQNAIVAAGTADGASTQLKMLADMVRGNPVSLNLNDPLFSAYSGLLNQTIQTNVNVGSQFLDGEKGYALKVRNLFDKNVSSLAQTYTTYVPSGTDTADYLKNKIFVNNATAVTDAMAVIMYQDPTADDADMKVSCIGVSGERILTVVGNDLVILKDADRLAEVYHKAVDTGDNARLRILADLMDSEVPPTSKALVNQIRQRLPEKLGLKKKLTPYLSNIMDIIGGEWSAYYPSEMGSYDAIKTWLNNPESATPSQNFVNGTTITVKDAYYKALREDVNRIAGPKNFYNRVPALGKTVLDGIETLKLGKTASVVVVFERVKVSD